MTRLIVLLAAVLVLVTGAADAADAAELIMFETDGCPFCIRWHKEIGPIYPKTPEGRVLPLRRARLGALPPDLKRIKNLRYAPTFVAVECGRELGRIVGYQGEDFFWGELTVIIKSISAKARPAC
jgi:hypothetical protein